MGRAVWHVNPLACARVHTGPYEDLSDSLTCLGEVFPHGTSFDPAVLPVAGCRHGRLMDHEFLAIVVGQAAVLGRVEHVLARQADRVKVLN